MKKKKKKDRKTKKTGEVEDKKLEISDANSYSLRKRIP